MTRTDPSTGGELLAAEYRNAIRVVAFNLLRKGEHEALGALWSELMDCASWHFGERYPEGPASRYHASCERDYRDLAAEVEDAYKHSPDFPRI